MSTTRDALVKMLTFIRPARALPSVPTLDGVGWLLPPALNGTRYILRSVGEWTALLWNGVGAMTTAPLSYTMGDQPIYQLLWRPTQRAIFLDTGAGNLAAVQVLRDGRWQWAATGNLVPPVPVDDLRAPRAADRLRSGAVTAYFERLTGQGAQGLWASGAVERVEQEPLGGPSETPHPFVDDRT